MRLYASIGRVSAWLVAIASGACNGDPQVDDGVGSSGTGATAGSTAEGGDTTDVGTAQPSSTSGEDSTSGGSDTGSTGGDAVGCNGHVALCERPFHEVVFAATHNSVAATDDGFSPLNANQVHGVEAQLQAGVRALLLDVTYDDAGDTALCHGRCALGMRPHVEVMAALESFLADNPREVVAIIYQDSVDPADVEADYVATGLVQRVFTKVEGEPWPTLGEMIEADTRLVVTAEVGGPPPDWYHHVWDLAWDTPYTFTSPDEFSCELNRGSMDNDLFLLNHWLGTEAGLPAASQASLANSFEMLHGRATECAEAAGRLPTFVAVDFYDTGDLFAVVDTLNGVR